MFKTATSSVSWAVRTLREMQPIQISGGCRRLERPSCCEGFKRTPLQIVWRPAQYSTLPCLLGGWAKLSYMLRIWLASWEIPRHE